jgi:hypothetical protein
VKPFLNHATWYVQRNRCHYPKVVEPIFRQNRSIHDFDEKTACTGTNVDGYGGTAEAIRSRRPPEPTTQQSSTMGASVYCRFFASSSTRGAESFSYYRSMPWIDSTKKIRRKTSSENDVSAIFSAKRQHRRFLRHGEENAGYLLISAVFLLTTFSNIRTAMCFEYSKRRETNGNDRSSDFRHDGSFRHGRNRSPDVFSGD